jgi:DNA replication protein DnaC
MKVSKLLQSGILPKWHNKTFDDFTNDPESLAKAKKYVRDSETFLKEGVGLYINGPNGTGKTLLLNIIMQELLNKGNRVKILSLGTLVTRFTSSWYDEDEYKAFYRSIKQSHFYAIEEIGKEYRTETSNLAVTALDTFLRLRLQLGLPTLFTSNLLPSEIEARYSVDIASMMREMAVPLKVTGEDFRLTIAAKNKKLLCD